MTTTPEELYRIVARVWAAVAPRANWAARIEREDAVQLAVMRCWSYRDRHDAGRAGVSTFYAMIARQAITMEIERLGRLKRTARHLSIDFEIGDGFSYLSTLEDPETGPAARAELADDIHALHAAIARLPAALRAVMEDQLAGVTQTDTAKRLGVSRQRVQQKYSKAVGMLTERMVR